ALVASAGRPELVAFWRSAAKPFQAIPLIEDGAAERWNLTDPEVALSCASHSSEPVHLELVEAMLRKIGCEERDLACGAHQPLSAAVAEQVARSGIALSPKWSNCSGSHAGMLALARHRGWPTAGYERAGHPVQERVLDEVARWTGTPRDAIGLGVDGCATLSFALSLRAMATAYARLAGSGGSTARRVRDAMFAHPTLVAGTDRVCTDLIAAFPGRILAKVGADGIYGAALPEAGLGLALKVEDGDTRSASVALLEVLRLMAARGGLPAAPTAWPASVARHREPPTVNTRGAVTGVLRVAGALRFPG
ncbi:MAG: asparaginase, partial [Gemmatimonadales bacterium]